MKKTLTTIATAAVLMLCIPAHTAQPTQSTEIFTIDAMCTGDTITGTLDVSEQFTEVTTNGIEHLNIHEGIHGTLIGTPSGNTYVVNGQSNEHVNIDPVTFAGTFVSHVELISQGSAPNESIVMTAHLTVNADGTVTVNRSFASDTCSQ